MSASTFRAGSRGTALGGRSAWQFGVPAPSGAVEWLLKRNCSITPAQLFAAYGGLCVLSLGVAAISWALGASLVMPFAWFELLAVGAALLVFARHAGDRERIALADGRLVVECTDGGHVERMEFAQAGVRVEPEADERSLIELSGRGGRIAVGRYLRPELRPLLADELREALRGGPVAARRGTDRTETGLQRR